MGLPRIPDGATPVWHQFVVRVANRERIRADLERSGVQTLVHYPIPAHRTPTYAAAYPAPLPITEQLSRSVLSLPMSPQLTEAQTSHVCEAMAEILSRCNSPAL